MPQPDNHQIFGVQRPSPPARVDLTKQDIELLREIVTYASIIPETTPWNALFHAYDAVLKAKRIDAALDDRCFRFLMRMAEVQGASWYDRYANLLSLWHYDVPPKSNPGAVVHPLPLYNNPLPSNLDRITITFKSLRIPAKEALGDDIPNQRIQLLEDDVSRRQVKKVNMRSNVRAVSQHSNHALHRKTLPPSENEKKKREELEKMKAEFAFPTTLFENTTVGDALLDEDVEPVRTATSFLNQEDLEDQNDEDDVVEITEMIPQIRERAGLIAAAEEAVKRYNNRQWKFANTILNHWRLRTSKAAVYHRLQWDLACSKDQRILLSQTLAVWRENNYWQVVEYRMNLQRRQQVALRCLDIWRHKTYLKVKRNQTINRNILMRKFFRAWKEQAQATTTKIRRFQLTHMMTKWRTKLAQNRALDEVAQKRYNRDLQYRAYWTLFYGYCNLRAPQLNQIRVKRHAIGCLKRQLKTSKEKEGIADAFYCFSTLVKFYKTWKSDLKWIREMEVQADEQRLYADLSSSVQSWRRSARFAPIIREHQLAQDANKTAKILVLWKNRLRQIKAADHVYQTNVLKSNVKIWRLQARLKQHERYVRSMYMQNWFDRYSCSLADRCYQFHTWKHWLGVWKDRLLFLEKAKVAADDIVEATVTLQAKVKCLQLLRNNIAQVNILEAKAQEWRRQRLLKVALNIIIEKHEQTKAIATWALSAGYFFSVKKTYKVWQDSFEKHKRQKRKVAYAQVVRNRMLRIKSQAFQAILVRHEHLRHLDITAQDFLESGTKVQLFTLFDKWQRKLRKIQFLEDQASELRCLQLLTSSLNKWTYKLQKVEELYHLAETYTEIARKDNVTGIFRKWGNAIFRRKLDTVRADMFRERVEANRRKAFVRVWIASFRENAQRRQIHDQFNREFVLEEEREVELAGDQLQREFQLREYQRLDEPSEVGERSIAGIDGFSMLDVSEWVKSNPSSAVFASSTGMSRVPQTPSARATRARMFLESKHKDFSSPMVKLVSTTPAKSPPRRFSRSVMASQFRQSGSGRPDLRFTQSLSSKLREEMRAEASGPVIKASGWGEGEDRAIVVTIPDIDETEEDMKASGSTTAAATHESPYSR